MSTLANENVGKTNHHTSESLYNLLRDNLNRLDPTHKLSDSWPVIPVAEGWRYDSDGLNNFDIPDMISELNKLTRPLSIEAELQIIDDRATYVVTETRTRR